MGRLWLILACALASASAASAQEARYDNIALGPNGPIAGATIAVCTQPATLTQPCSPLASLWTDSTGTVAAPNSLSSDALGNFHFYVAPGVYTIQIYGPAVAAPLAMTDQGVGSGVPVLTPLGSATASQNFNSQTFNATGSLWTGSAPANDTWSMAVFENSCALTCGSDFEVNHSSVSGGAGRFHVNSDLMVGPPGSATASQNFNSFAWDNEGSYFDGAQAQNNLWEIAVSTTPASGATINSRENIWPIFTGACSSCTADIALGGSGTNPAQGNPTTPVYDFPVLPRNDSGGSWTLTLEKTPGDFTANRTQWFADKGGPIGIAWRYTCTLASGTCTVTTSQPNSVLPSTPVCTANGAATANAMAVAVSANGSNWNVRITSASGTDAQSVNIICVENGET